MNVYELMATLSLDTKQFENGLSKSEGMANESGSGIAGAFLGMAGNVAMALVKTTAAVGGAAVSGLSAITGMAVKSYASYEQLTGGIETLFKDSYGNVMEYAKNAFKTAGMSTNDYMDTMISFSGTLIQSLNGDTAIAAEVGNRAITDMSDNVNKMGTTMEAVQNAYRGFSRGNYTMLDNLALGYGGTAEEMKRLIKDSAALTDVQKELGITVDSESMSFGNIINAISVMQAKMGIAGTTTKEAEKTIKGSLNAMKASWSNLITGFADPDQDLGVLIENMFSSVETFGNNVMPRIQMTFEGLGKAAEMAAPKIIEAIPKLFGSVAPGLISATVALIKSAGNAIVSNVPTLFSDLKTSVEGNMDNVFSVAGNIITNLTNGIVENAPGFLAKFMDIVTDLEVALFERLPDFIEFAGGIITTLVGGIYDAAPGLMEAGYQAASKVARGMIDNLPTIAVTAAKVMSKFLQTVLSKLPSVLSTGIQIMGKIAAGVIKEAPKLIAKIPGIIVKIQGEFKKINWASVGINIIKGIAGGIRSAGGLIMSAARQKAHDAFNAAKGALGIHSPSTVFRDGIGKQISAGIAVGIKSNNAPIKALNELSKEMTGVGFGTTSPMYKPANALSGFGNQKNSYFSINMQVDGANDPKKFASDFVEELQRMERMGFA